jgi:hypothetical protein
VDQGFAACAFEASSIGIAEHRLAGAQVAVAMFTNLTRDHLDYHGTMDAYGAAKRRAVRPGPGCAVPSSTSTTPSAPRWRPSSGRRACRCGPSPRGARPGCVPNGCATTTAGLAFDAVEDGQRAGAQRPGRRLQRQQPAGGDGCAARAGPAAG